MLSRKTDQSLRLVPASPLDEEVASFLIDKEAKGLSKGTMRLYRVEPSYFHNYLREQGIDTLLSITSNTIRRWLLQLSQTRNPGGVHASYRVLKTLLSGVGRSTTSNPPTPPAKSDPPRSCSNHYSLSRYLISKPCSTPVSVGHSHVIEIDVCHCFSCTEVAESVSSVPLAPHPHRGRIVRLLGGTDSMWREAA